MVITSRPSTTPAFLRDRAWWLVPLVVWAVVCAALLQVRLADIHRQGVETAAEGARNIFRMVVLTRAWNASHGGVYVPITPTVQPNPWLEDPRRDLTTTDGVALTLINPAYMTRQIAELTEADSGVIFHLTSLKPIRPQNKPDDWERSALLGFEAGRKEILEPVTGEHGIRLLRYMAPLQVDKACLQCHEKQGYKLGDIRGGISVTQRYAPIEKAAQASIRKSVFSFGVVFVLVATLGWLSLEQLRRRWLDLDRNIRDLEGARGELTKQLVVNDRLAALGLQASGFAQEVSSPFQIAANAVSQHDGVLDRIEQMLTQEEVDERQLREELAALRESDSLALNNLRRLGRLVQGFKRSSVDRVSEQNRIFAMKEVIDDVLASVTPGLREMPIEIVVDCPDDLWLQGVPGWLDQLLTNLTDNAIVHAFKNGRRAGRMRITAVRAGDNLRVSVADDGPGIAAEHLDHIFDAFYTTRGNDGRAGLGLFVCHHIVTDKLGGTIVCVSGPDAGCRFDISFPAHFAQGQEK
jgi:signal transduction histidine kinase